MTNPVIDPCPEQYYDHMITGVWKFVKGYGLVRPQLMLNASIVRYMHRYIGHSNTVGFPNSRDISVELKRIQYCKEGRPGNLHHCSRRGQVYDARFTSSNLRVFEDAGKVWAIRMFGFITAGALFRCWWRLSMVFHCALLEPLRWRMPNGRAKIILARQKKCAKQLVAQWVVYVAKWLTGSWLVALVTCG